MPILNLLEQDDADLRAFGKYVYESVFENYTRKQWGLSPGELDPSVTARVPIVVGRDDRYFQDTYQAMPANGYSAMVERILNTPGVRVLLNADFSEIREELGNSRLIYTGAIDELFGRSFGALPYRSLRFDFKHLQERTIQPVGQVNYPGTGAYTRVTEFKHLTGQQSDSTAVAYEYPLEHVPSRNEPFYPVPQAGNGVLFERYRVEARTAFPQACFAGRLGDYRYYNMDQAVARALALARQIVAGQKLAA